MKRHSMMTKLTAWGIIAAMSGSLLTGTAVYADEIPEERTEEAYIVQEETIDNPENQAVYSPNAVLYFVPHQDDELLTFGSAILADMAEGRDVHVILCSRGEGSAVREILKNKWGIDLTVEEFVAARDDEFIRAMEALGVPAVNVHFPSNRAQGGQSAEMHDLIVKNIILTYVAKYPGASVCTTTSAADHREHAAIGQLASDLYHADIIDEMTMYLDPDARNRDSEISGIFTRDISDEDVEKLKAACYAYEEFDPANKRYGIGYHSVAYQFDIILNDTRAYGIDFPEKTAVRYGGLNRYATASNAANGITLEGESAENFKAPSVEYLSLPKDEEPDDKGDEAEDSTESGSESREEGADGVIEIPNSDNILVTDEVIYAPHNGRGTTADSHGDAENAGGTLVIASGKTFPDALAAGSLGCEIILTKTDSLSSEARSEILRLLPERIIVMGGESAVSAKVFKAIQQLPQKITDEEKALLAHGLVEDPSALTLDYQPTVIRCGGKNRAETANAVSALAAENGRVSTTQTAIVATGSNYADAVSIAPYAAKTGSPIFLTGSKGLSDSTLQAIKALGDNCRRIIIVGGTGAVPKSVENQIEKLGIEVIRKNGADRYETSLRIAEFELEEGMSAADFSLVTGTNFPDALVAGPIAANKNSIILMPAVKSTKWKETREFIKANRDVIAEKDYHFNIFGSEDVVSRLMTEFVYLALNH